MGQQLERAAGQAETEREHDQPLQLMAQCALAGHAEGEPAVDGGVETAVTSSASRFATCAPNGARQSRNSAR